MKETVSGSFIVSFISVWLEKANSAFLLLELNPLNPEEK